MRKITALENICLVIIRQNVLGCTAKMPGKRCSVLVLEVFHPKGKQQGGRDS